MTGTSVPIVNVGYSSTNYWVVGANGSRLLVDLGYPGTMSKLRANLTRMGVPVSEIRLAVATHYHIDHAGCAQDLKRDGVPLLVLDSQVSAIPLMKAHTKPRDNFSDITLNDNRVISFAESRNALKCIGLDGEIIATIGHSDDSVSVVLDAGDAFIGDLTLPTMASDEQRPSVLASWRLLGQRGVRRVFPGHGPVFDFDRLGVV
jgi:ribonuclease/clavin/mitogillin